MEELWKALRAWGLESLAPCLVRAGVRSLSDVTLQAGTLLSTGIKQWQLEQILSSSSQQVEPERTTARDDLPVPFSGRRASLPAALAAALPKQRKRSLDMLDHDVLARSTNPSTDARIRTYLAICSAWEVEPWPLTIQNVRCFGASSKLGGN